LWAVLILLIPWPVSAAELPLFGEPTTGTVGQVATFDLTGEPAVDLEAKLGDVLKAFAEWKSTVKLQTSAPAAATATAAIKSQLRFNDETNVLFFDATVSITPDKPGVYVIAAQLADTLSLHRLEVGPSGPLPPTPPDPPNPPQPPGQTSGPAYVIVLAEHDRLTTEQAGTLLKLRAYSDSNQATVRVYQLNPAAAGSDARIAAYLKLVPASGQLPWCIITRARTDQVGAAVLWSGALPASADDVIRRVEEAVK
jgi:hypothetical protein